MAATYPKIPERWHAAITIALLVAFIALTSWTAYVFYTVDRGMAIHRLETETARLASGLFFEKMTAIAQLTIALLGGAWAFITVVDTHVQVKEWRAVTCFTLANISFILSLAVYVYGYDFIVARIFHHATFDVDAPFINEVRLGQQFLFLNGCINLAVTVLIGRRVS
jgi:hypothetical protein